MWKTALCYFYFFLSSSHSVFSTFRPVHGSPVICLLLIIFICFLFVFAYFAWFPNTFRIQPAHPSFCIPIEAWNVFVSMPLHFQVEAGLSVMGSYLYVVLASDAFRAVVVDDVFFFIIWCPSILLVCCRCFLLLFRWWIETNSKQTVFVCYVIFKFLLRFLLRVLFLLLAHSWIV